MKRILVYGLLFFSFMNGLLFAQDAEAPATTPSEADVIKRHAMLALSSPDYRVTAGDVYTLAYAAGGTPVSYVITVDSTYRIRVSNLGVINASGKTFQQLKTEAEAIVSNNYPLSGVQLVLTQPAMFKVRLVGEVLATQELNTWALARLSSLLEENLTGYASLRDVSVTSLNGQTKTYDVFKARRFGDKTQDPYVRPEDVIRVNRVERAVTIGGAVERPGTYQLLQDEDISDLISYYASGFSPLADPSRIELTRFLDTPTESGDKYYLNSSDIDAGFALHHLDSVFVPQITDLIPVIFVEGAIRAAELGVEEESPNVSNRITVRFNMGENYASLVQRNMTWFSAVSDTQNAYILREGERILINLNPMLYDSRYHSQYFVQANDVLVIPFRQYFVTVSGAVAVPGRYPYIPDRGWDYYVALAGGFVPDRNSREQVDIIDIAGNRLTKSDAITPETVITAKTNAALYYFNKYAPVITTILSIITTTITLTFAFQ